MSDLCYRARQIPLTQGQFVLVDDEDYEQLSKHKWYAHKPCDGGYRAVRRGPKHTSILMHRQLLGLKPGDKRHVDHRNHDTLDNRRSNLRVCTNSQNMQNGLSHKNSSSQYKGVSWNKLSKKWRAEIRVNGKLIYLGLFNSEIKAACAYDRAAIHHFGEFACLNIKLKTER